MGIVVVVVVVEEAGEAPMVVAVVALQLSTELEFPVGFVRFIGLQVPATVRSNAYSSTK